MMRTRLLQDFLVFLPPLHRRLHFLLSELKDQVSDHMEMKAGDERTRNEGGRGENKIGKGGGRERRTGKRVRGGKES
eukprot:762928-Hanusia_phi.AAC.9